MAQQVPVRKRDFFSALVFAPPVLFSDTSFLFLVTVAIVTGLLIFINYRICIFYRSRI
jgi:hypothetical protein